MEKLTYTPPEFAALFGKERTWAYRQLYKGKVQAITELGRTLIPKSEVNRLLKEAGRYLGSGAKVRKEKAPPQALQSSSKGAKKWAEALDRRKKLGQAGNGRVGGGNQHQETARPSAASRLGVYVRLAKSGKGRRTSAQ